MLAQRFDFVLIFSYYIFSYYDLERRWENETEKPSALKMLRLLRNLKENRSGKQLLDSISALEKTGLSVLSSKF